MPFGEDALGTEATCDSVAERKLGVKAWVVRISFRGAGRGARSGPASQRQAERTIIHWIAERTIHCSSSGENRLHLLPACLPAKAPRDFQEAWRGHSPPSPRFSDTRSFPALGPVLPWSPLTYHVAETTDQEG